MYVCNVRRISEAISCDAGVADPDRKQQGGRFHVPRQNPPLASSGGYVNNTEGRVHSFVIYLARGVD